MMSRSPHFDPNYLFYCTNILYFDIHNIISVIFVAEIDNILRRVEITKGKYFMMYPENLGIDLTHHMLYWIEHGVIHTSDYNGDHHKVMDKSDIYDHNFPSCFTFDAANDVEHNFFLENHQLQHFDRPFVPNYLVSISYQKDGKVSIKCWIGKGFHIRFSTVLKND